MKKSEKLKVACKLLSFIYSELESYEIAELLSLTANPQEVLKEIQREDLDFSMRSIKRVSRKKTISRSKKRPTIDMQIERAKMLLFGHIQNAGYFEILLDTFRMQGILKYWIFLKHRKLSNTQKVV